MMKRTRIWKSTWTSKHISKCLLKGSPFLKSTLSKLLTVLGMSFVGVLIFLTSVPSSAEISLAAPSFAPTTPPQAALVCSACHGAAGISNNPTWPNLAGQKKDYLESQIIAFKKGERKNQLMSPVSNLINDADISILAEFFSKLPGAR